MRRATSRAKCGKTSEFLYGQENIGARHHCASCMIRLYHDLGTWAAAERDHVEALLAACPFPRDGVPMNELEADWTMAVHIVLTDRGEDPS